MCLWRRLNTSGQIVTRPWTGQARRDRLEALKRQVLRLAQVGTMNLPLSPEIGAPVRSPTSITCSLTASGEATRGTVKDEAGGYFKPGIPLRGTYNNLSNMFVVLIGEDSISDDCTRLMSHGTLSWDTVIARTITSELSHPEQQYSTSSGLSSRKANRICQNSNPILAKP
jgi:hypothetical protein